jgi:hypothetical protein
VIACQNVQGLKNKFRILDFREALKGVDVLVAVETWTSEYDRIELQGYSCVTESRKKNQRNMRGSGGVAIMHKEKLSQRIQNSLISLMGSLYHVLNDLPVCPM